MRSLLAFGAILLLGYHGVAAGQPQESRSLITVRGDAEVLVTPDEVVITLGVETLDRDLSASKKTNDDSVKLIIQAVRKLGVEKQHIKTEHISIEPLYREPHILQDFIGYRCRKTIVVKIEDMGKLDSVLTTALETGANYVHGVQFRTTELRKYRDQARALAVKAAREKAADLARELGQVVGRPHSLQEEYSRWWSSYGSSWWGRGYSSMSQTVQQFGGSRASFRDSAVAPGQISVTAQVTVAFELESK